MVMTKDCDFVFDSIADAKELGHTGPFYEAEPCDVSICYAQVEDFIDCALDVNDTYLYDLLTAVQPEIQALVDAVNSCIKENPIYRMGRRIKEGVEKNDRRTIKKTDSTV